MRSRAFFFTTTTIAGILIIMGLVYVWRMVTPPWSEQQRGDELTATIRMNKTIRGTVTDVMQNAQMITVQNDDGKTIQLAIVPETRIANEKGETIDTTQIYRGSIIEGKGEVVSTDALIIGELRIVMTPEIVILAPTEIDPVVSPVKIEGLARGLWYFEAVFPVTITDADRKPLGQHYVTATKDWMSESLVPFTTILEFTEPTTATGFLVFKNDNPSGLEENQKTFEMPIVFSQKTRRVNVFFNNSNLDPAFLCDKVFPVTREIPWTEGIGRAAIEELLKGPNEQDKESDYFTNISPNVQINSLIIENGTARIDFTENLERNVGGSCRVTAIRAQIINTLKQFSTIREVIVSINGRTEDILQP
ncbi:TPA: hypothetical protein DDZ49_01040 [Candidatus Wolfebacteria bacterium]|uniref:GerMN domain-containing protein n=2 Tax=Candidatus Wolfeibacteriota TaxID=1752735 RepID=A0A0G4ARP4_9BACT|nr:MAG: hypothetical protein UX70_C0001G0690 [Candidatus Wolfebacteria bacterium GW2011_GWB1_47_1]KKU42388.1 MAG: hypothetical protein UX58_C0002G0102 [Candidatus Wolfebacteria bacterium GW2011_GWB2_46_69]KKU66185.1 MAG: hypothetical protein UX90_C0001G0244 [Candidatus Wolfebacteria bacterium GW2011_GWD2_47_17]KKU74585.1 MAG: hypothetical protein UY00_C0061G0017 [Candidatus Wolfebacteria bacterium GW2011_GWA1_47_6]HAL24784.1 hypothetical protein [Candidatus Wolfebacteria bacterium]